MMIRQSTQVAEEFGVDCACRGIVNIACTRCMEAIYTRYREEKGGCCCWSCCGCGCPGENSSVSKEAEHRSRDAR
jgi:hypothetical protein